MGVELEQGVDYNVCCAWTFFTHCVVIPADSRLRLAIVENRPKPTVIPEAEGHL